MLICSIVSFKKSVTFMFGTNDGLLVPRIPTDAAVARAVSVLGMVNLNRVNCVTS